MPPRLKRTLGWGVHLYTALGAVTSCTALICVANDDFRTAFLWLTLALVIDASDGALARALDVKKNIPEFDGAKLDDIVDYQTYVLVPFVLLLRSGQLVGAPGLLAAGAGLLASAYRFCHVAAKTPDHFFTGFPSYWNVFAFYVYVLELSPAWTAGLTSFLAATVFLPLRFVYPSRTVWMRPWTVGLGVVWGALLFPVLLSLPERRSFLATLSLFYPAYYGLLSFYMQIRGISGRAAENRG